jgi:hypothetical protein
VKDAKIPIGWLIPIVGLILLLGWFLGQQGWSVSKINPPGIELVPPTVASEITSTPLPTVTPIPTSRPPTSIPFVTSWIQEVGQVPESGTQLSWRLSPGQTFYLSGGQFQIGNVFCGGDAKQICVLIYQTSIEQTLTINSLIPRQNYIGITEILSPDDILKEKEPVFWIPPNCISGCKRATVLIFRDGKLENKMSFTAP